MSKQVNGIEKHICKGVRPHQKQMQHMRSWYGRFGGPALGLTIQFKGDAYIPLSECTLVPRRPCWQISTRFNSTNLSIQPKAAQHISHFFQLYLTRISHNLMPLNARTLVSNTTVGEHPRPKTSLLKNFYSMQWLSLVFIHPKATQHNSHLSTLPIKPHITQLDAITRPNISFNYHCRSAPMSQDVLVDKLILDAILPTYQLSQLDNKLCQFEFMNWLSNCWKNDKC